MHVGLAKAANGEYKDVLMASSYGREASAYIESGNADMAANRAMQAAHFALRHLEGLETVQVNYVDISWIYENGLEQKLSCPIRCF